VANDLRLYFMQCGFMETQTQYMRMNEQFGVPWISPAPFFLITHPKGNVLFDLGMALEVARDKRAHWGPAVDVWDPVMTEEQFAVNQLQALDVDPASVRYVVLSHLHLDHAGAIGHFPNAEYIVQRRELEYAYAPDWFQKPAYIRADFDREVRWLFLDGHHDDGYDVFGDGTIRTIFTPGHTPGHMSLAVDLQGSGPFVLTADAAYTRAHYDDRVLMGLMHCASDGVASNLRLRREVDRLGAIVVFGHDPEEWPKYEQAPEYYA